MPQFAEKSGKTDLSDFSRKFGVVFIVHLAVAWLLPTDTRVIKKTSTAGITVELGVALPRVDRGLEQAVDAQSTDGGAASSSVAVRPKSQRRPMVSESEKNARLRQPFSESTSTPIDPDRAKMAQSTTQTTTSLEKVVASQPGLVTAAIPQGKPTAEQETVRTFEPDVQAAYKENPKPPYPKIAFRMGAEGTVTVLVEVNEDGTVNAVRVDQSSGNQLLDQSALETIKGWRFRSARKDGAMSRSVVKVPITFRLRAR